MKLFVYDHNIKKKTGGESLLTEVFDLLITLNPSKTLSTTSFRDAILESLVRKGWSGPIRVSLESNITITSQKKNVGLCLQTGNMSRFYADLLKLQTLFSSGRISKGLFLIPTKIEAKRMDSNIANFERFVVELEIFKATITMPISVYSFERE